jgi:tetratricopeptide (TPR) repeat protein
LWAERYDRPLRDVFAVQDEIVRRIVTTLNLQLNLAQQGWLVPRSTENLDAYDDLLRGLEYFVSLTRDGNTKARRMFENAIQLDPRYAVAYALLGSNYYWGWLLAFDPNGLEQALRMEQQAVALDDSLSGAHGVLAAVYVQKRQYDLAVTEAQRGIALDPNSASGYFWLAEVLNNLGKPAEALVAVDKAMRLDPRNRDNYVNEQGFAYSQLGRCEEAVSAYKRLLARYPNNLWVHAILADMYGSLGDNNAARAETAQVEREAALDTNSALGDLALATALNATGRPAEALAAAQKAERIDPQHDFYLFEQGQAYTQLGRWRDASSALKRFSVSHPGNLWSYVWLAVDDSELGQDDAARTEIAEVLKLNPQFSLKMGVGSLPAETERSAADLRRAGLE